VARLERATLINTSDHGGGAELIAMTLLDGFNAAGTETYLAVGSKQTDDPRVVPFFLSSHVDYRRDTVWHRRARLGTRRTIDRQIGREDFNHPHSRSILELTGSRPDLVLCDNLHGGFFDLRVLPWLSRQVPVVLMLHDAWLFTGHCASPPGCGRWETGCGSCPDLEAPPAVKRDATRSNWERKQRILAASKLYVIARSEWMLAQAERSILADAIVEANVITGGVDLDVFSPGSREEARRAIGVAQDTTMLLYVANRGRFGAHKDFGTLRAAATLLAREPQASNCELIVVGQSGETEEIAPGMRIRHLPRCEPGDGLSRFYRAADLFVHASPVEAYGLTAAEALACGLPVVAASKGGIHEVVEQGRTGIIVDPGDAQALASAIATLLDNPGRRRDMSERALSHARAGFDRGAMVKETHAWCADIASRWRGTDDVTVPLRARRWRRYEPNGLARVAGERLAAIGRLERELALQAHAAQERLAVLEQVSLDRNRLAADAEDLRTRVRELEGLLQERVPDETTTDFSVVGPGRETLE
jgi:glycosyltransferase involved in cell wall biosynthesis